MVTEDLRRVVDGSMEQGPGEIRRYGIVVSNADNEMLPTSPSMVVYSEPQLEDVTNQVTEGELEVVGSEVRLKSIKDLIAGQLYRVVVHYDLGGERLGNFFYIWCTAPR